MTAPRPFFSYYGAKWQTARHLGPPRHAVVIEPFAGSACYSTRWGCRNVRLYDVSPAICALWDWLIGCSVADIMALPDRVDDMAEVVSLTTGPQMLLRFWIAKGRAEPTRSLSPWYLQHRDDTDCRVWGASVKARIARQKPLIERWTIDRRSWDEIPLAEAHWHVDPPYAGLPGRRYPCNRIDYAALGAWCRTLPGTVDVCENAGADWLPFRVVHEVVTCRGRRSGAVSREAVWRSDADLFGVAA